jgi:hypothetical protein
MNPGRITPATAALGLLVAGALVVSRQAGAPTAHATTTQATKPTTSAARPGGPGLMGSITSASGNVLKISLIPSHTSATVDLTTKTSYVVNGKSTKTRPSWKKGERVQVIGTKKKDGTYTAQVVMVGAPGGAPGPGGPPPAGGMPPVSGAVVSSTSSSLVVKTSSGKRTFKLTSSTRYLVKGKVSTSRPSFTAGQQVHVMASRSGSPLTARMVIVGAMPAPPSGGSPPGRQP